MRKFIDIDRETSMLLPHDLREWVPEDDMVHFIIESVEGMKLQRLKVNERGTGSRQYPPEMMLELLIYCYANGIFSSRRIERATYRDIAVRYLTADTHPDRDTIATFRRENFDAVAECFVGVLGIARMLKLLKVGTVSVDGTKVKANASITQSASDSNELEEDVRAVPGSIGKVERVLADSGYVNEKQVEALESDDINVYMATGAESKQCRRKYDYRPEKASKGEARAVKAQWLKLMKAKLETETGRALYARRKQTVEPVFGIIKHCMGFRQFLLRGLKKVAGEWQLVTMAYNFKRLWNLKMATE